MLIHICDRCGVERKEGQQRIDFGSRLAQSAWCDDCRTQLSVLMEFAESFAEPVRHELITRWNARKFDTLRCDIEKAAREIVDVMVAPR